VTAYQQILNDIEGFRLEHNLSSGWRFLYTSQVTFTENNGLLILGLNPGGDPKIYQDPIPSKETGNAYITEKWKSRLQSKFNVLMREVAAKTDFDYDALMHYSCTSNLLPFRSKRWSDLQDIPEILDFGRYIWSKALMHIRPTSIICIGKTATESMLSLYRPNCDSYEVITAKKGRQSVILYAIDDVKIIQIPHLANPFAFCDDPTLVQLVANGLQDLPAKHQIQYLS
jgi:hypothetical protein